MTDIRVSVGLDTAQYEAGLQRMSQATSSQLQQIGNILNQRTQQLAQLSKGLSTPPPIAPIIPSNWIPDTAVRDVKRLQDAVGTFQKAFADREFVDRWAQTIATGLGAVNTIATSAETKFKDLSSTISNFGNSVQSIIPGVHALDSVLANFGLSVEKVSKFAIGAGLFVGLAEGVKASIEFEHSLTELRMNTDLTKEQVDKLGEAFLDASTKSGIAAESYSHIAGELVKLDSTLQNSTERLTGISEAVAKISGTLHIGMGDLVNQLGELQLQMGFSLDDTEKLGSALVNLTNHSRASASEILNMMNAIAATGTTMGATQQDVMALAGAFAAVKAQPYVINQFLREMQEAARNSTGVLDVLADTANMTAAAFRNMVLGGDIKGAVGAFFEGANKQGAAFTETLERLNLSGSRGIRTFLALAQSSGELAKATKLVKEGYEDVAILQDEWKKKMDDTLGALSKLHTAVYNTLIVLFHEAIGPITTVTKLLTGFVEVVGHNPLAKFIADIVLWTAAISAGLLTLRLFIAVGDQVVSALKSIASAIKFLTGIEVAAWASRVGAEFLLLAKNALAVDFGKLIAGFGGVARAIISGEGLMAALRLIGAAFTPGGWLIIGIAAVTGALALLEYKTGAVSTAVSAAGKELSKTGEALSEGWPKFVAFLTGLGRAGVEAIEELAKKIPSIANSVAEAGEKIEKEGAPKVVNGFEQLKGYISTFISWFQQQMEYWSQPTWLDKWFDDMNKKALDLYNKFAGRGGFTPNEPETGAAFGIGTSDVTRGVYDAPKITSPTPRPGATGPTREEQARRNIDALNREIAVVQANANMEATIQRGRINLEAVVMNERLAQELEGAGKIMTVQTTLAQAQTALAAETQHKLLQVQFNALAAEDAATQKNFQKAKEAAVADEKNKYHLLQAAETQRYESDQRTRAKRKEILDQMALDEQKFNALVVDMRRTMAKEALEAEESIGQSATEKRLKELARERDTRIDVAKQDERIARSFGWMDAATAAINNQTQAWDTYYAKLKVVVDSGLADAEKHLAAATAALGLQGDEALRASIAIDTFRKSYDQLEDTDKKIVDNMVKKNSVDIAKAVTEELKKTEDRLRGSEEALELYGDAALQATFANERFGASFENLKQGQKETVANLIEIDKRNKLIAANTGWRNATKEAIAYAAAVGLTGEEYEKVVQAILIYENAYDQLLPEQKKAIDLLAQTNVLLKQQGEAWKLAGDLAQDGMSATDAIAAAFAAKEIERQEAVKAVHIKTNQTIIDQARNRAAQTATILQQEAQYYGRFGDFVVATTRRYLAETESTWIQFARMITGLFDQIQRSLSDLFFDFFKNGTLDLKKFFGSMLDYMKRAVADFLASQAIKAFLGFLSGTGETGSTGSVIGDLAAKAGGAISGSGSSGGLLGPILSTAGKALGPVLDKISPGLSDVLKNSFGGLPSLNDQQISAIRDRGLTQDLSQPSTPDELAYYIPEATGGRLPGYGGGDSVPAMLEPGEYVVRKDIAEQLAPALDAAHGFAPGARSYAGGAYMQAGGVVQHLATGGRLPGYGGGDSVPAMLEPGEYVVRKDIAGQIAPALDTAHGFTPGARSYAGGAYMATGGSVPVQHFAVGGSVVDPRLLSLVPISSGTTVDSRLLASTSSGTPTSIMTSDPQLLSSTSSGTTQGTIDQPYSGGQVSLQYLSGTSLEDVNTLGGLTKADVAVLLVLRQLLAEQQNSTAPIASPISTGPVTDENAAQTVNSMTQTANEMAQQDASGVEDNSVQSSSIMADLGLSMIGVKALVAINSLTDGKISGLLGGSADEAGSVLGLGVNTLTGVINLGTAVYNLARGGGEMNLGTAASLVQGGAGLGAATLTALTSPALSGLTGLSASTSVLGTTLGAAGAGGSGFGAGASGLIGGLSAVGTVAGAAVLAYNIANAIQALSSGDDRALGPAIGTLSGAGLGAAAGAIVGTVVFPGIGTAAGALAGAGLGSALGGWIGSFIGQNMPHYYAVRQHSADVGVNALDAYKNYIIDAGNTGSIPTIQEALGARFADNHVGVNLNLPAAVADAIGVPTKAPLSSLSSDQFTKLLKAYQEWKGFTSQGSSGSYAFVGSPVGTGWFEGFGDLPYLSGSKDNAPAIEIAKAASEIADAAFRTISDFLAPDLANVSPVAPLLFEAVTPAGQQIQPSSTQQASGTSGVTSGTASEASSEVANAYKISPELMERASQWVGTYDQMKAAMLAGEYYTIPKVQLDQTAQEIANYTWSHPTYNEWIEPLPSPMNEIIVHLEKLKLVQPVIGEPHPTDYDLDVDWFDRFVDDAFYRWPWLSASPILDNSMPGGTPGSGGEGTSSAGPDSSGASGGPGPGVGGGELQHGGWIGDEHENWKSGHHYGWIHGKHWGRDSVWIKAEPGEFVVPRLAAATNAPALEQLARTGTLMPVSTQSTPTPHYSSLTAAPALSTDMETMPSPVFPPSDMETIPSPDFTPLPRPIFPLVTTPPSTSLPSLVGGLTSQPIPTSLGIPPDMYKFLGGIQPAPQPEPLAAPAFQPAPSPMTLPYSPGVVPPQPAEGATVNAPTTQNININFHINGANMGDSHEFVRRVAPLLRDELKRIDPRYSRAGNKTQI